MLIHILSVILFVYIMPCIVGLGVSRVLRIDDRTVVKSFVVGNIFIWGFLQLITVPFVLIKGSFSTVVLIVNLVLCSICLWVLIDEFFFKNRENFKWRNWTSRIRFVNKTDMVSLTMMAGMLIWLLYMIITLQHTDGDDSRFVVNAVEMIRTDRLLLTDLITGEELETWIGEIVKDVTSPWAIYTAYCAKMTGISAVITAHSVLAVSLILCSMGVFWLMSKEFFKENLTNRSIFMCFVVLLNIYGHFSRGSAETMRLIRIWQGKASVASIAVPALFLFCMWLYENEKKYSYYIIIMMTNLGMCLMSGMGVVIGAIMLGCIGVVYGIAKKNVWMTIALWAMCIPNVMYYLINAKLG